MCCLIFLILSIILNFSLILLFSILKKRYKRGVAKNREFLQILINYVNSIRYGKITEKIDTKNFVGMNKNLAESINRMSETLVDREDMVREYQKIMLEKNQSLEKLIKQEQETHSLRRDFISTLGHDLKVPILAASNTLDFLLDGVFGSLNEKQTEALEKMKYSNSELIELVENILATYKSEEQNLILNKNLINLKDLISFTVEELCDIASREGHKFVLDLDNAEINIDAFQIKRVVKNILHNAISYSPKNSEILVSLKKENNFAVLKITDFGAGISKEDIERIFEKYYSCAKKFRKVGTGLGLYLSKQIIDAHGGTIQVESEQNKKTTFTINIPF